MKNDSTPLISPEMKTSPLRSRARQSATPRRSTIMMIRQFARAYSCAPSLPATLGSLVAN